MKFTSAELRLRRQVFRPPRPSFSPVWKRGKRLGRRHQRRRRCRRRRLRCFWKEEEGVGQKFGCKKLACLRGGWLFFSSFFLTRCLSSPPPRLPALSILPSLLSPRRRGETWGHPVAAAAAAAVEEGWRGPSCEKIFFLFRSTKIRLKMECFSSVWKIFVDGLKKSV